MSARQHPHPSQAGSSHGTTSKVLAWSLVLNLLFLVLEVGAGLWTGSLALLSDAAHMVGDVAALALALGVTHLAMWVQSQSGRWSVKRIEAIGGLLNGLAMLVLVALIVREAVIRLSAAPTEVSPWPVLLVGVIGLIINLACAWWLAQGDRDNLNIRGALLHMIGDALGSAGAVLAAAGLLLGVPSADALASLGIAALVLVATLGLLRDALRVLVHKVRSCMKPTCTLCAATA